MKPILLIAGSILIGLPLANLALASAPHRHTAIRKPSSHHLNEAQRQQVYFLRAGTEYAAADHYPDWNTPADVKDAYQDRLMAKIDKRFGITKEQAKLIDAEGLSKKWPMQGENGHVIYPR